MKKWPTLRYVHIYELAKSGLSNPKIAKIIKFSYGTFARRIKEDKPLLQLLKRARRGSKSQTDVETFTNFMYARLPENLQKVWKRLQRFDEEGTAIGRIQALLDGKGKRARQHLFLYALVHYNFSLAAALRCVGITRQAFNHWVTMDPDFAELVAEIHSAKKDFFEAALIGLVKQGDSAAIIFANKTMNSDRGYNPTKQVKMDVTGVVNHSVTAIPIDDLGLSLEDRKRLLNAYRKKQDEETRSITTPALSSHQEK